MPHGSSLRQPTFLSFTPLSPLCAAVPIMNTNQIISEDNLEHGAIRRNREVADAANTGDGSADTRGVNRSDRNVTSNASDGDAGDRRQWVLKTISYSVLYRLLTFLYEYRMLRARS